MEEAFETYITDETYGIMAFKIKMLKLKILGVLLEAEYKNDDDKYDKLDPKNYPDITNEKFDEYMNKLINGDGKYDDTDAKLVSNIKTLRLIQVINFISAGFEDKIKATLNIKYTSTSNPPKDKTALYISQLKLIIGYYDDALSSLSGRWAEKGDFTTNGDGAKKLLRGTRWYNIGWFDSGIYTPLSVTDNEQRYRHAILKRYMNIVRKYDEIMLKEIKTKNNETVDDELLQARKKFTDAFTALKDTSQYPKRDDTIKALELLDAYNKNVEASYNIIKMAGGSGNVGGSPIKYKNQYKYVPTGDVVYILYNKKRIKRNIYVKDKGRPTKYCKINKEYVLLSKLR
jgi:hypothetical protein